MNPQDYLIPALHAGPFRPPDYSGVPFQRFFDLPVISTTTAPCIPCGSDCYGVWVCPSTTRSYADGPAAAVIDCDISWAARFPLQSSWAGCSRSVFWRRAVRLLRRVSASRPEGEIQAAWFFGLLLLEAAGLGDWKRRWLCAGALLPYLGSGYLTTYAGPALPRVAVYMVWAVRSLGLEASFQAASPLCCWGWACSRSLIWGSTSFRISTKFGPSSGDCWRMAWGRPVAFEAPGSYGIGCGN